MDLTRADIHEALTELGERLHRRRKIGEITLFGGAAMLLQFDVSFTTGDIDAVIDEGHGDVLQAVAEIGRERGWYSTWLNDGVQQYLSDSAKGEPQLFGSFPSELREGLRVFVAEPAYLLAMKLRALRGGSRDREDALTLARHLGLTSADALEAALRRLFPHEEIDARRKGLLRDLAVELSG